MPSSLLVATILLAGVLCRAQSPQDSPSPTPSTPGQQAQDTATQNPAQTSPQNPENKGKQESRNSKSGDRLFFALPNFLTVENAANVPPLTAGGKFKLVGRSAFDPAQFVWYAGLAGISQASDSEKGFGQGAEGYGKRYGAYFADGTIENFFVGAIFPSMLHTDPRFFQSGKGTFMHRAGYAVSRAFVTRSDSGHNVFNASEIFGSAVSSAISTYSYHPHPGYHPVEGEDVPYIASDRTLKNTASVWGSQVGYDCITFAIKEFWPDLRRKIHKQH
ncbi:MAG TPA: hypothetical protein VMI10_10925 [Terriglobales bacterium]|nr:hypothetical protein [Terriglobales bacterium]